MNDFISNESGVESFKAADATEASAEEEALELFVWEVLAEAEELDSSFLSLPHAAKNATLPILRIPNAARRFRAEDIVIPFVWMH